MFILSLYNLQAQGITIPNAIVGMACFVGGLAQFAAGMWGMSLTTFSPEYTIDCPVTWSDRFFQWQFVRRYRSVSTLMN